MALASLTTRASRTAPTAEWDAFADSLDAAPFLRPAWFEAWSTAFRRQPVQLVTVHEGGELAGAMPVEACRGGLRTPTNSHSPFYAPLAASPEARDRLLSELFAKAAGRIELDLLSGGEPLRDSAARAARDRGRLVISRLVASAPYVDLSGDFDFYEQGLSRNRRRALRRQRRRLEETGEVTFEVHDGGERLDALLEEMFRVEASGWKGRRGTAIASRPQTRRFYTDVARWAAAEGWLRLAFLRVDGEAVAADYVIEHDQVWYTLKAGYDERLRAFGPGALLLREEIAHCFAAGLARLDLLGCEDPFKLSWTSDGSSRHRIGAFRRNPSGLAHWTGATARAQARRWRQTTNLPSR